jgi:hypothetical protein
LIHRGSSKAVRKKNFHRQSPAATLPFATGLGLVCGRDLADDFGLVLDVIDCRSFWVDQGPNCSRGEGK